MKNLFISLALLVVFTAASFAEGTTNPYNVTSNAPVEATLTITGNVVAPPIVIAPNPQSIELGDVAPGEFVTFTNTKQKTFVITCAKGYGIKVTGSTNLVANKTSIEAQVAYRTTTEGTWSTAVAIPAATAAVVHIPGTATVTGYAEVLVNVSKFSAEPGAYVGTRTFTFTASAEYE